MFYMKAHECQRKKNDTKEVLSHENKKVYLQGRQTILAREPHGVRNGFNWKVSSRFRSIFYDSAFEAWKES